MMPSIDHITRTYLSYLETYGLSYRETALYYQFNEPLVTQGWILHASVIPSQMPEFLERVVPYLVEEGASFKLIKDNEHHHNLNLGNYGTTQVGKAITIYPNNNAQALRMAETIIERTKDLGGPRVPTDFVLSDVLYTRYGSFNTLIRLDEYGNWKRYLYDPDGNMIEDRCSVPPSVPFQVPNPFVPIIQKMILPKKSLLLGGKCFIQKTLKTGVRGNVYTGWHISRRVIRSCIIKQGKYRMLAGDSGQDVIDRFRWEKSVEERFEGLAPVPAIYDLFIENGDIYLISQRIPRTVDLTIESYALINHTPWYALPVWKKLRIINWLEQILNIASTFKRAGLIHRDITGSNFLVKRHKRIYAIDLELSYDFSRQLPDVPYKQGTIGFMSPQQEREEMPTLADDIFSLGSLIILLTGGEPRRIIESDRIATAQRLRFFTQDDSLVSTVMACTDPTASKRPSLEMVMDEVSQFRQRITKNRSNPPHQVSAEELHDVIEGGTKGLFHPQMYSNDLWVSVNAEPVNYEINALGPKAVHGGISRGIAGVLYFLNRARAAGLTGSAVTEIEKAGQAYIRYHFLEQRDKVPGLHYGSAGVAFAIVDSHRYGTLSGLRQDDSLLEEGICRENSQLNIIQGLAGQGLAAIFYGKPAGRDIARQQVEQLVSLQEKDGSWIKPTQGKRNGAKINGFGYGIAGIAYFLLKYGNWVADTTALTSGIKALDYLTKAAHNTQGTSYWMENNRSKIATNWWCSGAAGIALTYLKAFEVAGNTRYRQIAESALRHVKKDFVHFNLSQCHGLSGLGEVYLEAYRVLGSSEWLDRATWITQLLLLLRRKNEDGSYYWLTEGSEFPTADLMVGCSGILHYLLRYSNPISFPYPVI